MVVYLDNAGRPLQRMVMKGGVIRSISPDETETEHRMNTFSRFCMNRADLDGVLLQDCQNGWVGQRPASRWHRRRCRMRIGVSRLVFLGDADEKTPPCQKAVFKATNASVEAGATTEKIGFGKGALFKQCFLQWHHHELIGRADNRRQRTAVQAIDEYDAVADQRWDQVFFNGGDGRGNGSLL